MALPAPGSDSLYYLIHEPIDHEPGGLNGHVPMLLYSLVDMGQGNGLGKVIEKNQLVLADTLERGKITACKHANGRDWWILVAEDQGTSTSTYRLLLTPAGIVDMGKQDIDPGVAYGSGSVGNAVFSPDGTRYVRHDLYFDPWNDVDVYGFDRCTGLLTHLEHFEISDTSFLYGGSAISPDSRYLYAVTNRFVYQYDLGAADIEPTKTLVGEYDGYVAYFFGSVFGTPQIGPDGKIYVASGVSDTVMHVINTPNQPGQASHFTQHSINLPNLNDKSIPNFPNYRLGPLDGSPCDTLGLDNHPLAGFTHFAEGLTVTFSDNSYYRPEEWEWGFGNGQGSTERNPIHVYDEPGEYFVCLTVRNEVDEDTFCRWVEVDTAVVVGTLKKGGSGKVAVLPNPASTQLNLQYDLPNTVAVTFSLNDVAGRQVKKWKVPGGKQYFTLPLLGVAEGLYFWVVSVEGKRLGSGKVMVIN